MKQIKSKSSSCPTPIYSFFLTGARMTSTSFNNQSFSWGSFSLMPYRCVLWYIFHIETEKLCQFTPTIITFSKLYVSLSLNFFAHCKSFGQWYFDGQWNHILQHIVSEGDIELPNLVAGGRTCGNNCFLHEDIFILQYY